MMSFTDDQSAVASNTSDTDTGSGEHRERAASQCDKFRIFLYEPINKAGLDLLSSVAEICYPPDSREETVLPLVRDIDAMIMRYSGWVTARIMDAAPRLRVIGRHGHGVDNIDVAAAKERRIYVVNTLGSYTPSVAESCVAMMLNLSKHILPMDRDLRRGVWRKRMGHELYGKTVGLVGFGSIGRRVGEVCRRGLGMQIVYYDTQPYEQQAKELDARRASLDDLLRESDYVCVLVPLTPETEGLIGARELALMKPTAFITNFARGPVIDEAALVEVLQRRQIAGAGLDVFTVEPTPTDNPLFAFENVVVTPHSGGLTEEGTRRTAVVLAQDVIRVLKGERPEHWVNAW